MIESCQYKLIGSWWITEGKARRLTNNKGNADEFEIDIVAVTLADDVEAYEVKRNADKLKMSRLEEKVSIMQTAIFQNKTISCHGLSLSEM